MVAQNKTLKIEGMTCAACVGRIERGLKKIPGIDSVAVNLAIESAHITYISSEISLEEILTKIESLGYKGVLPEETKNSTPLLGNDQTHFLKKIKFSSHWRLYLAIILTLPLVFTMVGHFFPVRHFQNFPLTAIFFEVWFQWFLATPVQFLCGYPFYRSAWKALKSGSPDMNVLVALGTSAAYFFSIGKWLTHQAHQGIYFETSAVLITLILIGKFLEKRAKGQTTEALKELLRLQPQHATLLQGNSILTVPTENLKIDDIVLIRPGEKIPIDGTVCEGHSYVEESLLTGESIPVEKKLGNRVIGGALNTTGFLKIQVNSLVGNSFLAQIIKAVEQAQVSKAPIQRFADTVSAFFVPMVILIALATFGFWSIYLDTNAFGGALERAIAVLVIACPCALGIATPTSILVGSGWAAKKGVLFKGAEYLEQLAKITTVVFDKTGTLTQGKPQLISIYTSKNSDNIFTQSILSSELSDQLSKLRGLEELSEHPLGRAISLGIQNRGIEMTSPSSFTSIPGQGVTGWYGSEKWVIGKNSFLNKEGLELPPQLRRLKQDVEKNGNTVVVAGSSLGFYALFEISDPIRSESLEVVKQLQEKRLELWILTGDQEETAKNVATQLGISKYVSDLLPHEKSEWIRNLKSQGKVVALVGDGINDAPALAEANLGISMGNGTDVAKAVGNINLVHPSLLGILHALYISKKTLVNIKQNLFWAFFFNILGIPLAVLGYLAPWMAGGAMALSSVAVILNALRLKTASH